MKKHATLPNKQAGAMLLEALISILIFSIGILAIVGLQAQSIKNAGDAKYRVDASLLANDLIARMWSSDRTQTTLQSNFQTSGPEYMKWLTDVDSTLPGVSGVAQNQPIVSISSVAGYDSTAPSRSMVTITIYWSAPTEAKQAHNFVAVTEII